MQSALLPLDLEREVLEIAAERQPSTVLKLMLLCRRTHTWLEPFLYRTVSLHSNDPQDNDPEYDPAQDAFYRVASSKPPSFLARGVRVLLMNFAYRWDEDKIKRTSEALLRCTNISRVLLTSHRRLGSPLNTIMFRALPLSVLTLRRLSTFMLESMPDLVAEQALAPPFRFLTHLYALDREPDAVRRLVPFVVKLPALTHFAVSTDLPADILEDVLGKGGCPHLILFVLLSYWDRNGIKARRWAEELPSTDPRVVVAITYEWDAGVAEETRTPTLWQEAEDFLQKKALGLIEKDCFWLGDYANASNQMGYAATSYYTDSNS
ncbi:hypothetical protein HMN09_01404200 [Mycena chlorophos]|uniref:Uncharacterized protein n=1 Tax=Mycena chlorophos TaxID=658473 RepID=A0A8H6RXE1_MYCCL|nr:hypothetical protein HMN09_01404200 [Mycena chlorophos]